MLVDKCITGHYKVHKNYFSSQNVSGKADESGGRFQMISLKLFIRYQVTLKVERLFYYWMEILCYIKLRHANKQRGNVTWKAAYCKQIIKISMIFFFFLIFI